MVEVLGAVVVSVSAIIVALVEKGRRENKRDHGVVSAKLDMMGKSLGKSIDRVEESVHRTEEKLDNHINEHAKGSFD
jgi:hypothetical protein